MPSPAAWNSLEQRLRASQAFSTVAPVKLNINSNNPGPDNRRIVDALHVSGRAAPQSDKILERQFARDHMRGVRRLRQLPSGLILMLREFAPVTRPGKVQCWHAKCRERWSKPMLRSMVVLAGKEFSQPRMFRDTSALWRHWRKVARGLLK